MPSDCRLRGDLEELKQTIDGLADRPTVMLATGDPLFYGIVRYLTDTFGKDRFEVVPHVSSMQLAFARVKESWDDAYLTESGNAILGPWWSTAFAPRNESGCSRPNRFRPRWSPRRCWIAASTTSPPTSARTWAHRTETVTQGDLDIDSRSDVFADERDGVGATPRSGRPPERQRPTSAVRQSG